MLKPSLTLAVCNTALGLGLVSPAFAAPRDFVGTWVNTDPNTGGITRLVVRSSSQNALNIQVFGNCLPSYCDWGTRSLVTYGRNVQDVDHRFATVTYNPGFSNTILTLQLISSKNRGIILRKFTRFLDDSQRQNYYSQERFTRLPVLSN